MSAEQERSLATYAELCAKVDAKFAAIRAVHPQSFQCTQGCHACCKPGLTVGPVEAAAIRRHFSTQPEIVAALKADPDPHGGRRCAFLDKAGACRIYAARPLICRSHGAPVLYKLVANASPARDVCPLNFRSHAPTEDGSPDLTSLDAAHFINLDTLNTILALLNEQHSPGGARVSLSPLALLGEASGA